MSEEEKVLSQLLFWWPVVVISVFVGGVVLGVFFRELSSMADNLIWRGRLGRLGKKEQFKPKSKILNERSEDQDYV